MTATAEIDSYLAGLPEDQRRALEDLGLAIAAAAAEAQEAVSYPPATRSCSSGTVRT